MSTATLTLEIPQLLYQRLVNTAQATQRPLEEIVLRALKVGSPPAWDNVPDEFQTALAALDKLDDDSLWEIARSQKTNAEMGRYNLLLEKNQSETLTPAEKLELQKLRQEADLFMLLKAQAAVLLRWRGYKLPRL